MSLTWPTKDPSDVLDYEVDWSSWLATGDEIVSVTNTITGDDSALVIDTESNTTSAATVWLSGGTVGRTYTVTCRIITAGGRTAERDVRIHVDNI